MAAAAGFWGLDGMGLGEIGGVGASRFEVSLRVSVRDTVRACALMDCLFR